MKLAGGQGAKRLRTATSRICVANLRWALNKYNHSIMEVRDMHPPAKIWRQLFFTVRYCTDASQLVIRREGGVPSGRPRPGMDGAHVFLAGILYEACFFAERPIRAKLVRPRVFLRKARVLDSNTHALPSGWRNRPLHENPSARLKIAPFHFLAPGRRNLLLCRLLYSRPDWILRDTR